MIRTKGLSTRFMVSGIVVLSVLITVVISLITSYRSEKDSLIKMSFQMNSMYTGKIAATVNELFIAEKASMKAHAEYIARHWTQPEMDELTAYIQHSNAMFNTIIIIDKNGIMQSLSPEMSPPLKGKKITTPGTLQALKERMPLVSEPYISAANALIVLVSNPVYDANGEYLGFIGGTIRLHESNLLNAVLGSQQNAVAGNGSYSYVVSATGALLYHPDKDRIGEHILSNPLFSDLAAGRSGEKRITNSRGVDMLASYSYIKELGWGIVSQTPTSIVLKDAKRPMVHIATYVISIMLVILLAIYWVIGRMSQPLAKLAQYASLLSTTKSLHADVPRIHSWNSEANALHRAFVMAVSRIRMQLDHLSLEAQTDALTGLNNRRTMDKYIGTWLAREIPFTIMLLDLDHFKQVNDNYGHEKGDEVLKFLAANMRALFEGNHICCRYGGEEFVVLLPETSEDEAVRRANKLRRFMAETNSPVGRPVTLSIGLARYPDSAQDAEALFRSADEALYRAKHLGRNRIESASSAVVVS
ncbi:sensor domain-containing diguanylate cyclase [Paenibacillus albus]|uniref:GGDEF domain-containing protein n=1 Tax=Paenibacillus albus TaxID=2495582 RepID=A0A3Q8X359_9BACL|nr:diguanylate cyclase [Paenibacillus albus]AZN38693.1 GGDEF domain-containing protein [Paenibacillus albus]